MCLAVPGKIISMTGEDPVMRLGRVSFGGIVKEINLAFVPDAGVGDYVMVHVGFAIAKVDEAEAERVFAYLRQIEELTGDADEPPGGEGMSRGGDPLYSCIKEHGP